LGSRVTDAELMTLAVLQALLGYTSEAGLIWSAHANLRLWFRRLPDRAGYTSAFARPVT
jgi:hypothetical protein